MSEQDAIKQSEIQEALTELRDKRPYVRKKPWVLTEKRAEVFARAAAKRKENLSRKKKEEFDRYFQEINHKAEQEFAAQKPTGQIPSQAPELSVNSIMPNKAPDPIPTSAEEKKPETSPQVRIVEKPIVIQDEVESIHHEHDHDDGWMTAATKPHHHSEPVPSQMRQEPEQVPPPPPLERQTNRAAAAADWAEQQMIQMSSRKRAHEETQRYANELAREHRMGTGAGNHAPYEGDFDYVDSSHSPPYQAPSRHMVSPEEALELLAMPKDVALRYLAARIASEPTTRNHAAMIRPYQDRDMEPVDEVSEFLSHTRHHAMRHPSQLHSSTSSSRYKNAPGDQFLWL